MTCIFYASGDTTSRKQNFEFWPLNLAQSEEMTHPNRGAYFHLGCPGTIEPLILMCDAMHKCGLCCHNNNNNNNNQDNVYGAVIMAQPLREFTQFI